MGLDLTLGQIEPSAAELLRLYADMRLIREVEQRLSVLFGDGEIPGFIHLSIGQEAVAVAAIFHEGRLQRRLDPCDFREIDVAAQLLALGGLEIKFLDAIAADHDNPGLFRVGGIDQHFVGHL